jgi:hypothetical protein
MSGLSYIAAGVAVEMMVAILHSPYGNKHPAPTDTIADNSDSVNIAVIPHQVRGNLFGFQQMHISVR